MVGQQARHAPERGEALSHRIAERGGIGLAPGIAQLQKVLHAQVEAVGIDRGIAALANRVGAGTGYTELATVITCEYLDLRWPDINWRAHATLAALHARLGDRPSLLATRPPG